MNEHQIGYRIRQHLNQGLEDLGASELARLRAARELAMARQRLASRPLMVWADNVVGRGGGPSSLVSRMLLPTAVLILGLIAVNQWRETQVAAEIEEIDAAVLTGDLPLDAYLDKGFDAWLKRSSQ